MRPDDFMIGWICALPTELAAATTLLDERHTSVPQLSHDRNLYILGRMADHNIVITCLPAGVIGVASAARVASQMRSSFPSVQAVLMVGVGGGAPSEKHDIRLGDVIVSQPGKSHSGVIQYDYGRTVQEGRFVLTGCLNRPPDLLLNAVANLSSRHMYETSQIPDIIRSCIEKYPRRKQACTYPGQSNDQLFHPRYSHPEAKQTCKHCLPEHLIVRTPRADNQPIVHYGLIASANQVMRDGVTRNNLQQERDVLCFEMEAAGLMDDLPCLVVRGVCDYADSHKNKLWQDYAAVTAAAYVKELLRMVPLAPTTASPRSTLPIPQGAQQTYHGDLHLSSTEFESQRLLSAYRYSGCGSTNENGAVYLDPIVRSTVHSAFGNFRKGVTNEDVRILDNTQLTDVRDVALRIETWHKQMGSQHYMRRIKPLLDGLEIFSQAASILLFEPAIMLWIWSPLKLVLEQAKSFDAAFDKLLDIYLEIAGSLPNFKVLQASHWDQRSCSILAFTYINVLEVHHKIYNIFQGKAWKLSFSTIWMTFQERFGTIKKNLKDLDVYLGTNSALFDVYAWDVARKREREDHHQKEQQQQAFCLQAAHGWLDIAGHDQMKHLARLTDKRYPDTCEWVLDIPQYQSWSSSSRVSSVLWMSGIPGSGKSIICTHIINSLIPRADLTTLFYFCRHQAGKDSGTCSQMLRTLIFQLIEKDPSLAVSVWEDHIRHGQIPSVDRLRGLLAKLLTLYPPARIIVDGLDESSSTEQKQIVAQLQNLSQKFSSQCRILISSREGAFIPKSLRRNPTITLHRHIKLVENDIASYIEDKLEQLREEWDTDVSVTTFDYTRQKLLDGSKGMFLWVELVIDALHYKMDDKGVRDALNKLPTTLQEAFDKIFRRMHDIPDLSLRNLINRCLGLMTYASRTLSVNEILSAVGYSSLSPFTNDPHMEPRRFLEFCKPLVEISRDKKVEFFHFSVKEYLLDSSSKLHIAPSDGHLELALSCLLYINTTSVFLSQEHRSLRLKQIATNQRDIHHYALSNWLFHICAYADRLDSSPPDSNLVKALAHFFSFGKNPTQPPSENRSLTITASIRGDFEWVGDEEIAQFLSHVRNYQADLERSEVNINDTQELLSIRQSSDPTCLSLVDAQFEIDIMDLLKMWQNPDKSHEADAASLDAFWSQQGVRPFRCRYSNCSHANVLFETLVERDSHELTHFPRIQCPILSCAWNGIGFKNSRDLKLHTMTYHPTNSLDLLEFEILLESFQQDRQPGASSFERSLNSSEGALMDRLPIPPRFLRQIINLFEAYGHDMRSLSFTNWDDLKQWLLSNAVVTLPEHHWRSIWSAQTENFHRLTDQRVRPDVKHDDDSAHLDPSPMPFKLLETDWVDLPEMCKRKGKEWSARVHPAIANFSSIQMVQTVTYKDAITDVTFSLDGKFVAIGTKEIAAVFELINGLALRKSSDLYHHDAGSFVRIVKFSPDAKLLATSTGKPGVRIWDVKSTPNTWEGFFSVDEADVFDFSFSGDGRIIASALSDRTILLFDTKKNQNLMKLQVDEVPLAVTVSSNSKLVAAGASSGKILIWDISTGGLKFESNPAISQTHSVYDIKFLNHEQSMLSASLDKTCKVWKIKDRPNGDIEVHSSQTFRGHEGFTSASITHDDKLAVAGGRDKNLEFWDVASGELIMVIEGHEDAGVCVATSPVEDLLVTVSRDGKLILWKYGILGNNQID